MLPRTLLARLLCATFLAAMLLPVAYAQKRNVDFASPDDAFLALRDAARRGDATRADEIAAGLGDYPIPSYVDYYRLLPRISEASDAEVLAFLNRYDGRAIADRLRNDWLLELGKRRDWATFDAQYPLFQLKDDTQLKCYALMSAASKGEQVANEARRLLTTPRNYGEGCTALIGMLVDNRQFGHDDLWEQVRLAADTGNTDFVRRLEPFTGIKDGSLVKAMEKPVSVVAHGPGFRRTRREVFIIALGRMARNDPARAADALESQRGRHLNRKQRDLAWAQIALPASKKLMPEADDYWHRAGDAYLSLEEHAWMVRSALRAGNWKRVREGIERMPRSLRDETTWIYWMARALREEGHIEKADALLQSIADQTNFYGQLALEDLGRKITIPPLPPPITEAEVAPMAANAGFRRAFKFFDLGLRFEGYREWNWELRKMNERQHLAAAEFARRNSVLDRMVNTSDRTKIEVDFQQRFPTPYLDVMREATHKLGLEMAWVYGLIRQESRFIMDARSHVGASGLMQLMPATARHVAKKIGFGDFSHNNVNDVETNILLGTNYLNMVLTDLDGSQTLATAAYNAGPGRSRAWRSTLMHPVEGAIFAETIPFSETRDYVKKVLSNATYYAAIFENKPQSLKARLGRVVPEAYVPSTLP